MRPPYGAGEAGDAGRVTSRRGFHHRREVRVGVSRVCPVLPSCPGRVSHGPAAQRRRILAAGREPRHGERTVASVAAEWGYSSETAFGTAFKRITGISPTQYRSAPLAAVTARPEGWLEAGSWSSRAKVTSPAPASNSANRSTGQL
ncbi:helix-turn-helix domain-containing protein [Streptomyces hygroscopicus]|uniref:helix-turn-helix domain-containing protein n=1 Tax=Streptomyces hygroscopicus TaxID=1912 RepID=UPI002AD36C6A|nr:helix-turn-helix domain-containing protein [Streptomyces hygroscopicus]